MCRASSPNSASAHGSTSRRSPGTGPEVPYTKSNRDITEPNQRQLADVSPCSRRERLCSDSKPACPEAEGVGQDVPPSGLPQRYGTVARRRIADVPVDVLPSGCADG